MKQIILIGLVFLLVACSPEIEQTPEVIPTQASVSQAELTPDVTVDVDTVAVSLAELSILEDTFTTSTTYSNATFGEAIFDAKCNACLILPDAVISSDSDISDVYAKAIYYADNIISPEGYLFTSMQENEWNTLTENEVYNVIAYFKSVYNADMQNIDVALLATPEPEATEEAIVETQEDTTTSDDTTETEDTASESNNPFVVGVANADPVVGEQLFTSNFVTPCNTCHFVDSEAMLVGPGLLNIGDHAEIRIEGVTAEEYLYTSIVHPNDFIVDGFAAAMPEMYETGLSQDEVYNLVAYLMTLGAEDDTTDDATTETDDVVEDPSDNATEEDTTSEDTTTESDNPIVVAVANADPINGEQLYITNFISPCNACHFSDTEAMLVGPGLLNIRDRAGTRVEGLTAEEYLYESIIHPNDFIVDGFAAAMPTTYETGLTEDEVYDLIAYLMSLGE